MSDFKKYLNVYTFDTVLPGTGETIEFKPLTTGQMKQILVYENEDDPMVIEQALDDLIGSSVITENFNVRNTYLQDRFFLLTEIRKKTKGSYYQFDFVCPQCNSQSLQSVNLDKLEVKFPPESIDPVVKLDENISIELDFVTRADQLEAHNHVKNKFGDTLSMIQLAVEVSIVANAIAIKAIVTPEGRDENVSLGDRQLLLEDIPRGQFDIITGWFEDNDFGVDFTFDIDCKHVRGMNRPCGYKKKVDLPTEQFFF